MALVYLAPVIIFAKMAVEIRQPGLMRLDAPVIQVLHLYTDPGLDLAAKVILNLASTTVILIYTLLLAATLWPINRRSTVVLLLGVGGAFTLTLALNITPLELQTTGWRQLLTDVNYSFPSNHAVMSAALALSLTFILWHTRWRLYAVTLGAGYCLIIGVAQIYLSWHYPSDVVGGWIIAALWLITVYLIFNWPRRRLFQAPPPTSPPRHVFAHGPSQSNGPPRAKRSAAPRRVDSLGRGRNTRGDV